MIRIGDTALSLLDLDIVRDRSGDFHGVVGGGRFGSGISKESAPVERPAVSPGFSISEAFGLGSWWDSWGCDGEREMDREIGGDWPVNSRL